MSLNWSEARLLFRLLTSIAFNFEAHRACSIACKHGAAGSRTQTDVDAKLDHRIRRITAGVRSHLVCFQQFDQNVCHVSGLPLLYYSSRQAQAKMKSSAAVFFLEMVTTLLFR
jgi:hypothetical protein